MVGVGNGGIHGDDEWDEAIPSQSQCRSNAFILRLNAANKWEEPLHSFNGSILNDIRSSISSLLTNVMCVDADRLQLEPPSCSHRFVEEKCLPPAQVQLGTTPSSRVDYGTRYQPDGGEWRKPIPKLRMDLLAAFKRRVKAFDSSSHSSSPFPRPTILAAIAPPSMKTFTLTESIIGREAKRG